ncbi:cyclic pyranopterin phosphate synthase [Hydrogenivirga caldilitoris]|uniref:cyclic pyranopterin monophosphate synthase n=1 Tax=Hydrogenivirga caldilitoris TaxID=246264 RepID=A0A497XQ24_9AQUI|nr:cyclic pyranopterin monophosphate synthase MoaC [Hydrogenivirga caldilitoris]RLJ70371.1 cyclic pyranopterin phosphate synthase [Hydrogenivirga caldilitoris]
MRTIDVGGKFDTLRRASAYGRIRLSPDTIKLIRDKKLPKGDLIEATKLTGIFGAKRTGEILPFCHPISLDFVEVGVKVNDNSIEVFSTVSGIARTGYEMEALTAVSTALLNVYDMCKGVDDSMVIEEIRLTEKSGGKSDWKRDLSGVKVNVLSQKEELKKLALSYLIELGAQESKDAQVLVVIGEPFNIEEELKALECVIALYDFRNSPNLIGEEIKVGRDDKGTLVILLPGREEKVRLFFETFGGIIGSLL